MKVPWQVLLLFYASGVYVCFLVYGVLVEDVERAKVGRKRQTFLRATPAHCVRVRALDSMALIRKRSTSGSSQQPFVPSSTALLPTQHCGIHCRATTRSRWPCHNQSGPSLH